MPKFEVFPLGSGGSLREMLKFNMSPPPPFGASPRYAPALPVKTAACTLLNHSSVITETKELFAVITTVQLILLKSLYRKKRKRRTLNRKVLITTAKRYAQNSLGLLLSMHGSCTERCSIDIQYLISRIMWTEKRQVYLFMF